MRKIGDQETVAGQYVGKLVKCVGTSLVGI